MKKLKTLFPITKEEKKKCESLLNGIGLPKEIAMAQVRHRVTGLSK